jgi:hypothetical protein
MYYSEILDDTTQRIKTQFNRHATLAIGTGTVLAGQTQAVIPLPAFSCIATDLVNVAFRNASGANADAAPLRSAVITVNPANGVPTLTITVATVAAATAIDLNYVVYRAAN